MMKLIDILTEIGDISYKELDEIADKIITIYSPRLKRAIEKLFPRADIQKYVEKYIREHISKDMEKDLTLNKHVLTDRILHKLKNK